MNMDTEEYMLERRATELKQAGDLAGAIECLKQAAKLRGISGATTRLAKFLQLAGRFDEAMGEIQALIDHSGLWAKENFGHQPTSVQHCQRASWIARIHDDAALLCKREKRKALQGRHEEESLRWWGINKRLKPIADRDRNSKGMNE